VVALVLLLIVAGCGQPERPYTPKEASSAVDSGAASAEPSSPDNTGSAPKESGTALTVPSPGVETVAIGDRVRVRIEWPADADPLLRVVTDFYVNSRRAVVTGDERYLDNLEFQAANDAYDWVQRFVDRGESLRGVARLYNMRVQAVVGKGAQVNTCVDESRLRLISARTGKAVSPQPGWTRRPYMESVAARRGDDGVWRIRTFVGGTEGCGK
jgi:hypothetical protein